LKPEAECSKTAQIPVQATSEKRAKLDLQPLMSAGWSMVEGRDAIYKEFLFKDFNEVSFLYAYKD